MRHVPIDTPAGETYIGRMTQVSATVRNPADPEKAWEGRFLVDTGAIDCLAPKGERVYALVDGSEVRMQVTVAEIELMGETVGTTIVFGNADAEPLLGLTRWSPLASRSPPTTRPSRGSRPYGSSDFG